MNDKQDIVARLRAVLHSDRSVELMNREAADVIEQLQDRINELCDEVWDMREERDEVRRDFCKSKMGNHEDGKWFAKSRGWDCYPRK